MGLKVDPRVCGGAAVATVATVLVSGRSPRVRGSRLIGYHKSIGNRSIPACAGEPRHIPS